MGWWRRLFGGRDDTADGGDARDDGWIRMPEVNVAGSLWIGELWDHKPLYAPGRVDVTDFLGQRPLPYVWPDDPGYLEYVGESTEALTAQWLYIFMHHPDHAVVADALRQPQIGQSTLTVVTVADLLMYHPDRDVREEAARAVWRCDDAVVRRVVKVLREELELKAAQPGSRYVRDAEARLVAARPHDRPDVQPD